MGAARAAARARCARTIAAVLAALALGRCGCGEDGPVSDVDLVLVPERQLVDFGDVWVGGGATDVVRLSNLGDAPIRFDDVTVVEADGPFVLLSPAPATLARDESVGLSVRFTPVAPGPREATLVVISDADNAGTLRVTLRGAGAAAPSCDDANACTDDAFDVVLGACVHTAAEGACDDGSACTTLDRCAAGVCVGEAVVCDDDDPCTLDVCEPTSGCRALPDPDVCDDENPCTEDFCLEGGACASVATTDNTVCSDVFSCAGIGLCQSGTCVDFPVPDGTACSDGDVCTTGDVCADGVCVSGSPPDVVPGVTSLAPILLPLGYSPTLGGAARRFGDRVVQVAPGFAAVFDISSTIAPVLIAAVPLEGGYRGESVAMFDDGRAVVLLSREARLLVIDPTLPDDALVAELALPAGATPVAESLGMVSAGDRVLFLHDGTLFALDDALTLAALVELPPGMDGVAGTPTRLFAFHRTPLTPGASTRIFDVTDLDPVERAALPYSCRGAVEEGDRVACLTLRDIGGAIEPRVAVLDVASIDDGAPVVLAESTTPHLVPASGPVLVGGDLVLLDLTMSALVRVDPLTGEVRESHAVLGRSVTALDGRTLLTTDGELVVVDPEATVGASFTRVPRADLGAVVRAEERLVVDGDGAWIVGRGGVARVDLEGGQLSAIRVTGSALVPTDNYRGAALVRVPTGDGTTVVRIGLGGPSSGALVPIDVTWGPTGPVAARRAIVLDGKVVLTGGAVAIEALPTDAAWRVMSTTTAFASSGVLELESSIPASPYLPDPGDGIPQVALALSATGRRAVVGTRIATLTAPVQVRYVVVDLTAPSAPTVGGAPIGAPPLAPGPGVLDLTEGPGEEGAFTVDGGALRATGDAFLVVTAGPTFGTHFVLAVDATDALAPVVTARGAVAMPALGPLPVSTAPLLVTSSGRVFFAHGPFGPAAGRVTSVAPGIVDGGSVVSPAATDVVAVPSLARHAALVGDALLVVGDAWVATISPPCD